MSIFDKIKKGLTAGGIIEDEAIAEGVPPALGDDDREPIIAQGQPVPTTTKRTSYATTRRTGNPTTTSGDQAEVKENSSNTSFPAIAVDQATLDQLTAEVNSAVPQILRDFFLKLEQMKRLSNEKDRYAAALIAINATPEQILEAMDIRFSKLDSEIKGFEASLAEATKQRIDERLAERDCISADLDELNSQIEEVRRQMAEKAKEIDVIERDVQEEREDIEDARATFRITADRLRSTLVAEREKTVNNLK